MRRIVRLAAILNLTYFGIEFAVALAIGSVSLFADSIDFLEDTTVNFLILLALDWSALYRARMGMILAGFCSCREWPRFGQPGGSSRLQRRLHPWRFRSPGPAPSR
jgi:hypothetical protein